MRISYPQIDVFDAMLLFALIAALSQISASLTLRSHRFDSQLRTVQPCEFVLEDGHAMRLPKVFDQRLLNVAASNKCSG